MSLWFHSTILATSLAATIAVGFASASIYSGNDAVLSAKTDRLPVSTNVAENYMTTETRYYGVSVLTRVPATKMQ